MRKIISVVLAAAMLVSLAVVGISAAPNAADIGKVAAGYKPEGTGIASLAEATDPAGKYYLTADIKVDATLPVTFTGTIDGNGHTVTISAPVFEHFGGTVKNLIIAGSVDDSAKEAVHTGTIARHIPAETTAVFENVKNTATVKGVLKDYVGAAPNGTADYKYRSGCGGFIGLCEGSMEVTGCANTADINGFAVGGFLGYCESQFDKASHVLFKDSVNTGKLTDAGVEKVKNNGALGGMVGICNRTKKLDFINCHNSGEIAGNVDGKGTSNCPAGGIIGYNYVAKNSTDGVCNFTDCTNTANITGANQVGGIAGAVYSVANVKNCSNTGNITSTTNYAGGIISRNGCDSDYKDKTFIVAYYENCVNRGNVKSANQYVGGIAGFVNAGVSVKNCENYGSVDSTASAKQGHAGGIVSLSQTDTVVYGCVNYGNVAGAPTANISAGGIIGRAAHKGGAVRIERCTNFGDVVCGSTGLFFGPGGIAGYIWGGSSSTYLLYCVNAGKVTATGADNSAAGLATYLNTNYPIFIQYCINVGEITVNNSTGNKIELWYNKSITELDSANVHHNFYLAGDGKIGVKHGDGDAAVAFEAAATAATAEDLASGKLCFELNEAIKAADASVNEDVFYQLIGTDKAPNTVVNEKAKVEKAADGSFKNPSPAPVETDPVTPPTTDPADTKPAETEPESPVTGDNASAVIIALAIVAIAGTACLFVRKKVTD